MNFQQLLCAIGIKNGSNWSRSCKKMKESSTNSRKIINNKQSSESRKKLNLIEIRSRKIVSENPLFCIGRTSPSKLLQSTEMRESVQNRLTPNRNLIGMNLLDSRSDSPSSDLTKEDVMPQRVKIMRPHESVLFATRTNRRGPM